MPGWNNFSRCNLIFLAIQRTWLDTFMILLVRELLIRLITSIKTAFKKYILKILAEKVFILLLGTRSAALRSYFIQHLPIRIHIWPRGLKKNGPGKKLKSWRKPWKCKPFIWFEISAATFRVSVEVDCRWQFSVHMNLCGCTSVGGFWLHCIPDGIWSPGWRVSSVETMLAAVVVKMNCEDLWSLLWHVLALCKQVCF